MTDTPFWSMHKESSESESESEREIKRRRPGDTDPDPERETKTAPKETGTRADVVDLTASSSRSTAAQRGDMLSGMTVKQLKFLIFAAGLGECLPGLTEKHELQDLLAGNLSFERMQLLLRPKWQPFYLIHSDGIDTKYNGNSLQFSDIFSGDFKSAILSNFQIDVDFILKECPRLADRDVSVCLLHGLGRTAHSLMAQQVEQYKNITLANVDVGVQYGLVLHPNSSRNSAPNYPELYPEGRITASMPFCSTATRPKNAASD